MSRTTVAKNRPDKTGKGAATAAPVVLREIVPGKFNDNDWLSLLDHDDSDDFIGEVVEQIVDTSLDAIYKRYISRQIIPYTINIAKTDIEEILEWRFLAPDKGEIENEECWIEEEEPSPVMTDCWAQGSVPKQYNRPPTPRDNFEYLDSGRNTETQFSSAQVITEPTKTDEIVDEKCDDERKPTKSKKQKPKKLKPRVDKKAPSSEETMVVPEIEPRISLKQNEARNSKDEAATDSSHMPSYSYSMLRVQAGRPPGNRDALYDEYGNIISVTRINPDRLPSHNVRTGFRVIDPEIEAAQARLEAMRTGRYLQRKAEAPKQKLSVLGRSGQTTRTRDAVAPLPPPLLDTMEIAAGVVIKEGTHRKVGPLKALPRHTVMSSTDQQLLRPLSVATKMPRIRASTLFRSNKPLVTQIRDLNNIQPMESSAS